MKVIVYSQPNGNVAVCMPTNEIPIEELMAKHCPEYSIIIDKSELPQGDDENYFNAWELVDGKVVVNVDKKSAIQNAKQVEEDAKQSAISKLSALGLTEDEIKSLKGYA